MTAAPAPAIGYSLVANLGGDRQMTIQCFVGEDETDKTVNAKIDRALRVLDRQKAKYELKDLREELVSLEGKIAQFEADKAKIDHDFKVRLETLALQAAACNDDYKALHNKGYENHVARGRQGPYVAAGADKANLERLAAGAKQYEDEKQKACNEREQAVHGVDTSLRMHRQALEGFHKQIAEREALLAE